MRTSTRFQSAIIAAAIGFGGMVPAILQAGAPPAPQGIVTMRTYSGDQRAAIQAGTAIADGVFHPKRMEGPYNGYPGDDPGDDSVLPPFVRDNYTTELIGYFYPPKDGRIQFAIAMNGPGELYLSTDEDPAHKRLIAVEPEWNDRRAFATEFNRTRITDGTEPANRLENQSAWVTVVAGQPCFIQSISRAFSVENHAVAYRYEGDPDFQDNGLPIPGQHLSSIDIPTLSSVFVSRVVSTGNGVVVEVHDALDGTKLNLATMEMQIDGAAVPVTGVHGGNVSTLTYDRTDGLFAALSTHAYRILGNDSLGGNVDLAGRFVVPNYAILTRDLRVDPASVDTSRPGFIWNIFQNETYLENSIAYAEAAVAGQLVGADSLPLPNLANPNAVGVAAGPGEPGPTGTVQFHIPGVINLDQAGAPSGKIVPDGQMPGVPGLTGGTDGIGAEAIAYVHLPAGWMRMGVNSDDGFRTTAGRAADRFKATFLGEFNGGRGPADTLFNILVEEDGYYGLRTVWEEGGGGASIEWFVVGSDETKHLINGSGGPKAYRALVSTVVIAGCDSGVKNVVLPNMNTLADQIAQCAASAKSHGEFVRCVARITDELVQAKVISGKEKGALQNCAAKADLRDLRSDGLGVRP